MKNKNLTIKLISIFWFIIYSFLIYFLTYIIKYGEISISIYILKSRKIIDTIKYILISYSIVLAIFLINKSIFRDTLKSNIISTILILLTTLISYYKFKILDIPFVPADVLLIGNMDQIMSFGLTMPTTQMVLMILVIILLLVLHYLYRKPYYEKKPLNFKNDWYRILLAIIGVSLLYFICISPNRFDNLNLKNDFGENYSEFGGNGLFFMHLGDLCSIPPKEYTKENIQKIQEESKHNGTKNIENNKNTPNVIIIMNEAFSDPNKIKNVEYSSNPIGNIENLNKTDSNCIIGNIISPVIGGGTSLPEFEALTGLSSFYIPKQIFPYTSYIRKDMNSIVRIFNNADYTTIGIHTNTRKLL